MLTLLHHSILEKTRRPFVRAEKSAFGIFEWAWHRAQAERILRRHRIHLLWVWCCGSFWSAKWIFLCILSNIGMWMCNWFPLVWNEYTGSMLNGWWYLVFWRNDRFEDSIETMCFKPCPEFVYAIDTINEPSGYGSKLAAAGAWVAATIAHWLYDFVDINSFCERSQFHPHITVAHWIEYASPLAPGYECCHMARIKCRWFIQFQIRKIAGWYEQPVDICNRAHRPIWESFNSRIAHVFLNDLKFSFRALLPRM